MAARKNTLCSPLYPNLGAHIFGVPSKEQFLSIKMREISIQMVEVGEIVFTGQGGSGAVCALLSHKLHITLHTWDVPAIRGPSKAQREYAKGLPNVLNTLVEAIGFWTYWNNHDVTGTLWKSMVNYKRWCCFFWAFRMRGYITCHVYMPSSSLEIGFYSGGMPYLLCLLPRSAFSSFSTLPPAPNVFEFRCCLRFPVYFC